jgi:hypothetical protein
MPKWSAWFRPFLLLVVAAAAGIAANVALLGVASGSSGAAVGHFKPRLQPAAAATTAPARRGTTTNAGSKPRLSTKPQPTTTAYSTGSPTVAYDDHGSGTIGATEPPDD